MAKVRVYELARDLGLESKDVLERAQELGLEVKTASSGLDEDGVALVRMSYDASAGAASAGAEVGEADASPDEDAAADAAPADAGDAGALRAVSPGCHGCGASGRWPCASAERSLSRVP